VLKSLDLSLVSRKNKTLARRGIEESGERGEGDGELSLLIYQAYYIFPRCP